MVPAPEMWSIYSFFFLSSSLAKLTHYKSEVGNPGSNPGPSNNVNYRLSNPSINF
jgi:hypothetical protein